MKLFEKFLRRPARPPSSVVDRGAAFDSPIAPDQPFFVIGDIHGCLTLLGKLLLEIEKLEERPQVICVGDMLDRGEQSAGVLNLLLRLNGEFGELVTCLMGNHEAMLLDFLDHPERSGDRWLRNGGLQTLASYRVLRGPDTSHRQLRDRLAEAMGPEMIQWLRGLPLRWQSGNVAVVHAGADPMAPMDMQAPEVLLWGTADFARVHRTDGLWIAHGHSIVRQPLAAQGRISTDTGAYATGRLTAAYIQPGSVRFIEAH